MLKASRDLGILWLTNVIKQVWQTSFDYSDWKNEIILLLLFYYCWKGKGQS